MKKSVVICDVEAISSYGNYISDIFENLIIRKKNLKEKFNLILDFDFYNHHYRVNTRIDKSSQLCIHTTAQLYKKKTMCNDYMIGLITASKYGCAASRSSYLKQLKTLADPQFASPKDFVQSICNIPNSLATIECGIKGITNHYVGTSDASLTALWQATKCLKDEIAHEMIVSSFHVIVDEQIGLLSERHPQDIKYSEAAASIKVQLGADINQNNVLFEILGIGFGSGIETEEAVEIALSNAIKESNITKKDISFIISNSNLPCEFYKNEKRGIENVFSNPVPTLLMKSYIGECFASFPLLTIAILSRMSGYFLLNNLFSEADMYNSRHLIYDDVMIKKDSIVLIVGYCDFGNAIAICLKYAK